MEAIEWEEGGILFGLPLCPILAISYQPIYLKTCPQHWEGRCQYFQSHPVLKKLTFLLLKGYEGLWNNSFSEVVPDSWLEFSPECRKCGVTGQKSQDLEYGLSGETLRQVTVDFHLCFLSLYQNCSMPGLIVVKSHHRPTGSLWIKFGFKTKRVKLLYFKLKIA